MAGISSKPVKGATYPGLVWVFTRLGIKNDATVDSTTTINGTCGTWTKTGTGEYTFTLNTECKVAGAGFRKTDGTSPGGMIIPALEGAAASTFGVERKSLDWTSGTCVLRIYTKSTGAAVDANAALVVDCAIALFDSSVT